MTNMKDQYKKLFGERIRQLRIAKDMSQDELARRIGYESRSSVNKIEVGKNDLPRSKLVALAHALDVDIDSLLDVNSVVGVDAQKQELIRLFNAMSEQDRELALALLRKMSDKG